MVWVMIKTNSDLQLKAEKILLCIKCVLKLNRQIREKIPLTIMDQFSLALNETFQLWKYLTRRQQVKWVTATVLKDQSSCPPRGLRISTNLRHGQNYVWSYRGNREVEESLRTAALENTTRKTLKTISAVIIKSSSILISSERFV